MPAKVFNNHTELIESLTDGKHKLNVSSIKFNARDQTKQYPFAWLSLTDTETNGFHSGLSVVFATDNARLPVVFVAEQSGSTLCRVNETNVPVSSPPFSGPFGHFFSPARFEMLEVIRAGVGARL